MRRLLLLLLTFLLPLQLLAATVGDVSAQRIHDEKLLICNSSASSSPALQGVAKQGAMALQTVAADTPVSPQPGDDDEPDAPGVQADCEDQTLPAVLATPHVSWHPFPHTFAAPLNWPSFYRDQLRPPPLA